MNKKQIQMQICKALIDADRRLCKAKINDDEVMITTDGFSAFVLFEKECVFDLSKIPEKDGIAKYMQTDETDEEVFVTNKKFVSANDVVVGKLKGENHTVYANEKFIKVFGRYHLFANKSNSRIVAKNEFGMAVGMFCPMRFNEDEER